MNYVFAVICFVLAVISAWISWTGKMDTSTMEPKLRFQVEYNKKARRAAITTIIVIKLVFLTLAIVLGIVGFKLIT